MYIRTQRALAVGVSDIDLVCANWDERFDADWIPQS